MRGLLCVILILLVGGCGSSVGLSSADYRWANRHGGLTDHAAIPQLQASADRLAAAAGLHGVRVHVLNTSKLVAYARPTDDVFVSAGLIAHMPADQLHAAIAHEMGHLAMHHGSKALGLTGTNLPADEEMQADRLGAELLRRSGADASAMRRMLKTMRDGYAADVSMREQFTRRIELLTTER